MSPDHCQASFSHVSWPNSPGRGMTWNFQRNSPVLAFEPHDVARDVLDPSLAVAGLVPHEHHDHAVHHNRRPRAGDHTELPRDPVIGVVRSFVPALPRAPALQQLRYQVDDPGLREIIERYGRTPALQRPARLCVERPKEEGGGRDIDHSAAVHLTIGDPFPVGPPRRAQIPDGLRLAKDPERLARSGVDRHHLPARSGHRVEHSVDVDRGGPGKVVDVGAEIIAPPDPLLLEVREVSGVDLVQHRSGPGVPGIAAKIAPLAVLGPWQALSECGRRRRHEDGEGEAETTHESLLSGRVKLSFHDLHCSIPHLDRAEW